VDEIYIVKHKASHVVEVAAAGKVAAVQDDTVWAVVKSDVCLGRPVTALKTRRVD